ncbi:MAG: hypothetical protein ACE14T_09240 [Syntrophales bacterium]
MRFGSYNFSCVFTEDALLPAYKGSSFRGVFGHALKKVACALRHRECRECILRLQCIYVHTFETTASVLGTAGEESPLRPFLMSSSPLE